MSMTGFVKACETLYSRMRGLEMNDLGFTPANGAAGGEPPLDVADPWDATVLDEAALLSVWTGTTPQLFHSTETAASEDGNIYVCRSQLDGLFGAFAGETYKTAIFFALAHEFGHLCQFKHFGVSETFHRRRIRVEAHADVLAGAWLGVRLVQGEERRSDDVVNAGLKLKAQTTRYPSPYQRSSLVQDAMGLSVMVAHLVEPRVKVSPNEALEGGIKARDVADLYEFASRRLKELPRGAPKPRATFGSFFRRAP